jgi:hypothetical protein
LTNSANLKKIGGFIEPPICGVGADLPTYRFSKFWQSFNDPNGITHNYNLQAHIIHFGETVDSGNDDFKIFILN